MSQITPAASVLLSRGSGSRELYAILRGAHLRFFGGFWAFPGGKLSDQDYLEVRRDADGAGVECELSARRVAACRELFEETGILIARGLDGAFPTLDREFDHDRQALLDERLHFGTMLNERRLRIHAADFAAIGEITTPAFSPLRFATTFFVAQLPPNQTPTVWPGELDQGQWIDGPTLLARWRRGENLVTPPSVMSLEILGERPVDAIADLLAPVFARLSGGATHPIYFAPCVQLAPFKTAALPPSAYTNTILIGNGPRYIIDPGPDAAAEQQRLFEVIDEYQTTGRPFAAIVLSHHHPDHVGAARACADRYRLPIWAHARTAELLSGRVTIDRHLLDGDRLDLGPSPADGAPWRLEVLYTPGHASGHLAFFEPVYRVLLAGDMISTMTSVVIAPPDGDLAIYLQSLHRLRELPTRLLIPAHGNVSTQPGKTIADALEHRAKREAQLLESLADGPITIDDLTARNYRGTPEPLMRLARAQTLAGLLKLQGDGQAAPLTDDRWSRTKGGSHA